MNAHLIDFIDSELKQNNYYEAIRKFSEDKDWCLDILSPIVNEYDDNIDNFGPYRFMDAIEDYIEKLVDRDELSEDLTLDDIFGLMWDDDWFDKY